MDFCDDGPQGGTVVHSIGSCCRTAHEGFQLAEPRIGVCRGEPKGGTAVHSIGSCCRATREGFQIEGSRTHSIGFCHGGPQRGTLVHSIEQLFTAFEATAERHMWDFNSQLLAKTAW